MYHTLWSCFVSVTKQETRITFSALLLVVPSTVFLWIHSATSIA